MQECETDSIFGHDGYESAKNQVENVQLETLGSVERHKVSVRKVICILFVFVLYLYIYNYIFIYLTS